MMTSVNATIWDATQSGVHLIIIHRSKTLGALSWYDLARIAIGVRLGCTTGAAVRYLPFVDVGIQA